MRKLLFFLGAASFAAACGCSPETVTSPSGTPTSIMETVSEASYDDGSGIYKAVLTDGKATVTLYLGTQPEGVAMDSPMPSTGNYSIMSSDESNRICEGSSWTDAGGSYAIADGSVSAVAGDAGVSLSGSVSDGKGNFFRFKGNDISFTHSLDGCVVFGRCRSSYADGKLTLSLSSENVTCDIVLASDGEDVPSGKFSLADGTLVSAAWNEADDTAVPNTMTLSISRKGLAYRISGVVSMDDADTRIMFDGDISSGTSHADIAEAVCGNWIPSAGKWYVYDNASGKWGITDSYDKEYSMDIIGLDAKSALMFRGLYEQEFNVLATIKDNSIFIDANPETNPVAHVTTEKEGYWLFYTLFDPDIEYLMIWDDVEFKVADDFGSIGVVEEIKEFTNSQTGQKQKAHYRYFGIIGIDEKGERVAMFETWPFMELPVFTKPGFVPSSPAAKSCVSVSEPLKASWTVAADEIISITPILY